MPDIFPFWRTLRYFAVMLCWPALMIQAADKWVVVNSQADVTYTEKKFGGNQPRLEHYVFMQGRYYPGGMVDGSLEKMTFRQIAESLAPELARKNYMPVREIKEADLLIVVHWGATMPRVGSKEMQAQTEIRSDYGSDSDGGVPHDTNLLGAGESQLQFDRLLESTEMMEAGAVGASNASLLGYGKEMRRLGQSLSVTEDEAALRSDLSGDRYFVIIKAYDLRAGGKTALRHAVWTLHANVRSPGNNFNTALAKIGNVASDFFGRTTDKVESLRARPREGVVVIGDVTVVNEHTTFSQKK